MVTFIRNLFGNSIKTNPDLNFAVITGCLRISKESIFTGMNNLKVNTISDQQFTEYFGFTDDEVDELLSFYNLQSHKAVVKEWYDGYKFGTSDVYSPWNVINFCDKLRADPNTPRGTFFCVYRTLRLEICSSHRSKNGSRKPHVRIYRESKNSAQLFQQATRS